jgi:hypothetical protein
MDLFMNVGGYIIEPYTGSERVLLHKAPRGAAIHITPTVIDNLLSLPDSPYEKDVGEFLEGKRVGNIFALGYGGTWYSMVKNNWQMILDAMNKKLGKNPIEEGAELVPAKSTDEIRAERKKNGLCLTCGDRGRFTPNGPCVCNNGHGRIFG